MNTEVKATLETFLAFLKASDLKKTGDQIVAAFETGIKALLLVKKDIVDSQKKNDKKIATALDEMQTQIDARLLLVKDGKTPTAAELIAIIKPLIPTVEDGDTPSEEQISALILKLLPPPPKDGSPDYAEDIRNKLEALVGKDRLSMSAIDGLAEALKQLSDRITFKLAGGDNFSMASQAGRDIFADIDLSPQFDGIKATFQIPAVYNIISVSIQSMPNNLRKNIDYTYTPTAITFAATIDPSTQLAAGQNCTLTVVRA